MIVDVLQIPTSDGGKVISYCSPAQGKQRLAPTRGTD